MTVKTPADVFVCLAATQQKLLLPFVAYYWLESGRVSYRSILTNSQSTTPTTITYKQQHSNGFQRQILAPRLGEFARRWKFYGRRQRSGLHPNGGKESAIPQDQGSDRQSGLL